MSRLALLLIVLPLVGCSGGGHDDLQEWMSENTKNLRGNIPKLPEVEPYQAVPYAVEGMVDPFRAAKIEPDSRGRKSGNGGLSPDFEAREARNSPLEKYPLESLKMVGYLNVNNRPMGLVQVGPQVRQVKVGDYMGLDFGMVTKVTETEITLKELIEDSSGDWAERVSVIHRQGNDGGRQ